MSRRFCPLALGRYRCKLGQPDSVGPIAMGLPRPAEWRPGVPLHCQGPWQLATTGRLALATVQPHPGSEDAV